MKFLKTGLLASLAVAAAMAVVPTTADAHGWGYKRHGYYKVYRPYAFTYHYYKPRYFYGYRTYKKW